MQLLLKLQFLGQGSVHTADIPEGPHGGPVNLASDLKASGLGL